MPLLRQQHGDTPGRWASTSPGASVLPVPAGGPLSLARPLELRTLLAAFVGHVALGILMSRSEELALLHVSSVLLVCGWLALTTRRPLALVSAAAYLTGAEVLWRMTGAAFFWELGKYAVAALCLAGLVRQRGQARPALAAVVYFACLLPAVALSLSRFGLNEITRQRISFNLSGPLVLAMAVLCLSRWRAATDELSRVLWILLLPLAGTAAIASFSTATGPAIVRPVSQFVGSGGYGPNQVSGVLGLAALCAAILSITEKARPRRLLAGALGLWFLTQATLTFSRGGVLSAGAAILVWIGHVLRGGGPRSRLAATTFAGGLLAVATLSPWLDSFTSGAFSVRFTDLSTTGRRDLAEDELRMWQDNPFLGLGVGGAADERAAMLGSGIASHTEFTRVLAEHGLLGLLALFVLLAAVLRAYSRAPSAVSKGWTAAFATWALLTMGNTALRTVAAPFAMGLAFVTISDAVFSRSRLGGGRGG